MKYTDYYHDNVNDIKKNNDYFYLNIFAFKFK